MTRNKIFLPLFLFLMLFSCRPEEIRIDEVELDRASLTLTIGETQTLSATVSPADCVNPNIEWHSDDTSVAVVKDGIVEAVSPGAAIISVVSEDNPLVRASCKLLVLGRAVTSVSMEPRVLSLRKGEKAQLEVSITPSDATVQDLSWFVTDSTVIALDSYGMVEALATGSANVVVSSVDGACTASCSITVTQDAEGLVLSSRELELYEDENSMLVATLLPDDASDKQLYWESSNESAAVVFQGNVVAVRAGEAVIRVRAAGGSLADSCRVTVKCHVKGVSISGNRSLCLEKDSEYQLEASVYPDRASNTELIWESKDPSVVSVSDEGLVKANGIGKTVVTVTTDDGGHTASCDIEVTQKASGIRLDQGELELYENEEFALVATVLPDDATDKRVVWTSSDDKVASVDGGQITAHKAGEAVIRVRAAGGSLADSCKVTVKCHVKGVSISGNRSLCLEKDSEYQLEASVYPDRASNTKLIWESEDPSVVSVSDEGLVKANGIGKTVVTVTTDDGGHTASCDIEVTQKASGIRLDRGELLLYENEEFALVATVLPEGATDKRVVWTSSENKIASVDIDGMVTAHKAGEAVIRVSAAGGSLVDSCKVTVKQRVHASAVTLDKTSLSLMIGDTIVLKATISPSDAYEKELVWGSSDPSRVKVDDKGKVTALAQGEAQITVQLKDNPSVKAVCQVSVSSKAGEITSVSLSPSTLSLKYGETGRLNCTVYPQNASYTTVKWETSNSNVATVSGSGLSATVTARGEGSASITVTVTSAGNNAKTATCSVRVSAPAVKVNGLTLDPVRMDIYLGQKKQVKAIVSPSNASDPSVVWSASQGGVASVDQAGWVTPMKVGTTRVIARTNDGGYERSTSVNVYKNEVSHIDLELVGTKVAPAEKIVLKVGESIDVNALIFGKDPSAAASSPGVSWISSNQSALSVSEVKTEKAETKTTSSGRIKALKAVDGPLTVTVRSTDDTSVFKTCEVTVLSGGSSSGGNEGVGFEDWNF